ncbi:MAG: UDP-N-acetylmuramoyl-tripeptide--D-alanyl-D-alanine ligase [Alphaproteobacteria bacterium]
MTALWTSNEAAQATGGRTTTSWQASGVSIDSRTVQAGDLFIAIKGPNMDGHAYVRDAFSAGAAAAMVADSVDHGGPLLTVPDTENGMTALARHARDRSAARIVAVTGSAGKTGTKDALALVLGRQGKTTATSGNLNNHWGLPLSLARLPRDARFGVFEMGMSAPGEIAPLSRLAHPEVAIITNVESAHLEFFDSEEGIADAKAEIFTGMDRDGTAVLNRDNRHFERLRRHADAAGIRNILTFGVHDMADFRLAAADVQPAHSRVSARIPDRDVTYTIGAPGRHWALNSLSVLAAVTALDADVDAAMAALTDVSPPKGRGSRTNVRLDGGSFLLIDESYNASPASMRVAFDVLGTAPGRRIAVLGDMRELGPQAPELHAGLAESITGNNIDLVFLAGENMAHLAAALGHDRCAAHGSDSAAILPIVRDAIRPGDVVMVKGSFGSNMAPVVAALAALDRDADAEAMAGGR